MSVLKPLQLLALCAAVGGGACAPSEPGTDDSSMHLTGSEELAALADGGVGCKPDKVLVCHIPPGNPANAHAICVGKPAVAPHQRLHGDGLGACVFLPDGGVGSTGDGGITEGNGGTGGGNPGNGANDGGGAGSGEADAGGGSVEDIG